MKYIIILADGMSDESILELDDKTPLEYAQTPNMDRMSKQSEIGIVNTIPKGMSPGSDVANLSVLGYNPHQYYTGRSPLEALSIGVPMKETDIAIRCNFVTLSEQEVLYSSKTIIDHSSSEITTEEAAELIEAVKKELNSDIYQYYLGTSYRHLTIWNKGEIVDLTPPHDILGKTISEYLPKDKSLREMMEKSYQILKNHPINTARKEKGLNPANSIWFWGAGTKPVLKSFEEKTGKTGAMISAVDLLKGIAIGSDMKVIEVEGANATLDTNYLGKANAAVNVLLDEDYDFVYVHIEAPDEMGHQGSYERKVEAIEHIDEKIIGVITDRLDTACIDYRILILPDHSTPVRLRTHTSDAVPYMLYDSTNKQNNEWNYNEREAKLGGNQINEGYTIIDYLIN